MGVRAGHLKPGMGRALGGKAHRAGKGSQNLGKSWVQGWLRRGDPTWEHPGGPVLPIAIP